ncbi:MAG: hypothetical protein L6R39_007710, partial [Caloplaca ligustica]
MECRSPNDIYLLLKSSDFITHDLEQAFDGCEPQAPSNSEAKEGTEVPYHLVLRKTIPAIAPSLEFRCFIRRRTLLCICQRDLNYYDFLPASIPTLRPLIQTFFDEHLKDSFEDEDFVFDVYIPPPHRRVWLIDINPWAPRTDPLLFSWLEILRLRDPFPHTSSEPGLIGMGNGVTPNESSSGDEEEEEEIFTPEFRLVGRNDPEA